MTRIHGRVAVAAAVVAVVLAGAGWRAWAATVLIAGVGYGACVVEVRERRIPTRLVAIGAVGIFDVVVAAGTHGRSPAVASSAVLGVVLFAGALGLAHLTNPAGMGVGYVRLAAFLGATCAVATNTVVGAFAAGVIASVAAAAAMILTHRRRMVFAPFLVGAAAAVAVTAGIATHLWS